MDTLYAEISKGKDGKGEHYRWRRSRKYYFGPKKEFEDASAALVALKEWMRDVWANKKTFLKITKEVDARGPYFIWKNISDSKHYYGPGHKHSSAAVAQIQIRLWVEKNTDGSYGSYSA
jgi:hypothetical protein